MEWIAKLLMENNKLLMQTFQFVNTDVKESIHQQYKKNVSAISEQQNINNIIEAQIERDKIDKASDERKDQLREGGLYDA